MTAWTTAADLRAQVQRLWDRGRLLACLADGESPFPLRLALKVPTSGELADRFDEVRAWSTFRDGSRMSSSRRSRPRMPTPSSCGPTLAPSPPS